MEDDGKDVFTVKKRYVYYLLVAIMLFAGGFFSHSLISPVSGVSIEEIKGEVDCTCGCGMILKDCTCGHAVKMTQDIQQLIDQGKNKEEIIEIMSISQPISPKLGQAYQIGKEIPDILKEVPCFCGCRAMGHTGLMDCITTDHVANCILCMEEIIDTYELHQQGLSVEEIRDRIIAKYGK